MSIDLREIVDKIAASKKYKATDINAIERIVNENALKYSKAKDIEKAAREKLHAVSLAFAEETALDNIKTALLSGEYDQAYKMHSSTCERMPLDAFYDKLFEITGKPETVIDLGCGLNPVFLALQGIDVTGCDMNSGLIDVINGFADDNGLGIRCFSRDLLLGTPFEGRYDMALFMKLLPVIETQKKGFSRQLIDSVDAGFKVITFPTRSLGGKKVGMEKFYSDWFEKMSEGLNIHERYVFNYELVYIIKNV